MKTDVQKLLKQARKSLRNLRGLCDQVSRSGSEVQQCQAYKNAVSTEMALNSATITGQSEVSEALESVLATLLHEARDSDSVCAVEPYEAGQKSGRTYGLAFAIGAIKEKIRQQEVE